MSTRDQQPEPPQIVELIQQDDHGQGVFSWLVWIVTDGERRFKVVPVMQDADDAWLTAKQAEKVLEKAGPGVSWKSVYRLADEGEIVDMYPLPHTRKFSLASLLDYAERVKSDPEYWQRKGSCKPTATPGKSR